MTLLSMETLLVVNNLILSIMLILLVIVAILLFKYIKIFNNINENTEKLKKDLLLLNRTLTLREQEEFLREFD